MGYTTYYKGLIKFNPKNKKIICILKYIHKLYTQCDFVSEYSHGQPITYFDRIDQWIAYCSAFDNVDYNKGIIYLEVDAKIYEMAIIKLIYLMMQIDDKVKVSQLRWKGEDRDDKGTIKIVARKLIYTEFDSDPIVVSDSIFDSFSPRNIIPSKIPKIDFLKLVREMDEDKLQEYITSIMV